MESMIISRTAPGPCLFCRQAGVRFNREHLPTESVAGCASVELHGWVCVGCNVRFSVDEVYFASHYHGAEAGALLGVTGKRWRGALIERTDLVARYNTRMNTATMLLKRPPAQASFEFRETGIGSLDLAPRVIDAQRVSRCLAKMALETVAWQKPDSAFDEGFDAVRDFALRRGVLTFLPYALGAPFDDQPCRFWEIQFTGETSWVAGALITLPAVSYAVQLTELADLNPLWNFARLTGMTFDQAGTRTRRVNFRLNMERPSSFSIGRRS